MIHDGEADSSAHAFRSAIDLLVSNAPGALRESGPHGTLLGFTGGYIPGLNTVISAEAKPDAEEIALLAAASRKYPKKVPWMIRHRGDADPRIVATAAEYGLTDVGSQPFLTMALDGPTPADARSSASAVRPLAGDEYEILASVLGASFGVPPEVITSVYTPAILDLPEVSAYVAEQDGVAVAVGQGFVTDGHLGVGNIATLPDHRRHGHARAVAEAILHGGRNAGAHTTYLHSTDEALALFEGLGFRLREHWTTIA